MLSPYPTEFPLEAARLLIQSRDGSVPRNTAIHAAVEVARYAAGQAFPDGPVLMGDAHCPCEPCTLDECCAHLQKCCDDAGVVRGATAAGLSLPWGKIAAAVLQLLLTLLANNA